MAISSTLQNMIANAQKKYQRNDTKAYTFKEGRTVIRILATNYNGPNAKPFWRDMGRHWIKFDPNGKPVAVVGCAAEVHNEPCAICNAIDDALHHTIDEEQEKLIKSFRRKRSVVVAALIRGNSTGASDDPQIVELPITVFNAILDIVQEYGKEVDILSPQDGLDFVVTRTGKFTDTNYTVVPAVKSQPVPAEALKKMPNLDAFVDSFFTPDGEAKALATIGQLVGRRYSNPNANANRLAGTTVAQPALPAAVATPTVAAATASDDAVVADVQSNAAKITAALDDVDPPFDINDDELESMLDDLD